LVEFEEWFRQELPRLLRLATVLSGNPDSAQDLVQDVLIRVEQRWAKLSVLDHRDAYIRRMLVNEYLSYRRKFSRLVLRPSVDPADRGTGADFADQQADRAALREALARLPRRQRAVLVLRYYDDADDHTIGHILGCRPSTVRSHASRALKALRISPLSNDHTNGPDRKTPPQPQAAPTNGEEDSRAHRS
jgi:RNA polymerase sigma-70 factor (sigma-E family)